MLLLHVFVLHCRRHLPPPFHPLCLSRSQMILTIAVGFIMSVFLSVACLMLRPTYHDPYPRSGSIVARSHSRVVVGKDL